MLKLIDDYPEEAARLGVLGPLRSSAKALDRLYIPTRYPNGLPDLTPFEVTPTWRPKPPSPRPRA